MYTLSCTFVLLCVTACALFVILTVCCNCMMVSLTIPPIIDCTAVSKDGAIIVMTHHRLIASKVFTFHCFTVTVVKHFILWYKFLLYYLFVLTFLVLKKEKIFLNLDFNYNFIVKNYNNCLIYMSNGQRKCQFFLLNNQRKCHCHRQIKKLQTFVSCSCLNKICK